MTLTLIAPTHNIWFIVNIGCHKKGFQGDGGILMVPLITGFIACYQTTCHKSLHNQGITLLLLYTESKCICNAIAVYILNTCTCKFEHVMEHNNPILRIFLPELNLRQNIFYVHYFVHCQQHFFYFQLNLDLFHYWMFFHNPSINSLNTWLTFEQILNPLWEFYLSK